MKNHLSILVLFLLAIFGCRERETIPVEPKGMEIGGPGNHISFLANHFFNVYAERTNWDDFLSLYHDSIVFQDVMLRKKCYGKSAFKSFYNWPDTNFAKHPEYPMVLKLETLVTNDSLAVGRGYFTPFYYQEELFGLGGHMKFTIWLTFDKAGKITKQVDYIVYPPKHLKAIAEGFIQEGQ